MEVLRCPPEQFDALCRLWFAYRRSIGLDDPPPAEVMRFRQQTFKNPFAPEDGTSWVAWDQDRAIAHLKESICPVYFKGQQSMCGWWQGFFALPDLSGIASANAAALLALTVASLGHAHAMLGTPGTDSRVFKLYERMRFDYWGAVPFFYYVVQGDKFLRNLCIFKRNRLLERVSAISSRLYFPGKLIAIRHYRRPVSMTDIRVVQWQCFPPEGNLLWEGVVKRFPLIFDRSTRYLDWRYSDPRYERLGVYSGDRLLGWVICKVSAMRENKYFGDLVVGSIVDFLVDPDNRRHVEFIVSVGLQALLSRGVDIIVTNLSDRRMVRVARSLGFTPGPSNFHFFTKNLRKLTLQDCHLTRGDSDGDGQL
jgi:hypothetical protein